MKETNIEALGLMKVQVEGGVYTVPEAIQQVIDYLMGIASSGDARALRAVALLGGVDISLQEFALSLAKSPRLVGLCKRARSKTFDGVVRMTDLGYLPTNGRSQIKREG